MKFGWLTYWLHDRHILLLLLDHGLEVHVDFDAERGVVLLPQRSLLLDIVHSAAALLTIDFQLFDLVQAGRLLLHRGHVAAWGLGGCNPTSNVALIPCGRISIGVAHASGRQTYTNKLIKYSSSPILLLTDKWEKVSNHLLAASQKLTSNFRLKNEPILII